MTSLDAKALHEDAEGLAFLSDVLKTAPGPKQEAAKKPAAPAAVRPDVRVKATRRTGLIGATALAALVVAVSPAKPATPDPKGTGEAAAASVAAAPAGIASCPKVRRKLWVEGEGWIVRAVAKCW